jgi:hypothetical protein
MKKVLVICCFVASIATFLSCLKEADLPTLTTTEVSNIKNQSALSGGTVTDDGGAEINVSGVCWGTADNPTIANSIIVNSKEGTGSFDCILFGLTPGTYYHVRAFAKNRVGTAYGDEVHFTTTLVEPKVTTASVSGVSYTIARADGYIEYDEETAIIDKGFCLATTENPTIEDRLFHGGVGAGSYVCTLLGLQPGTLYHVRAYSVTSLGITYGIDIFFETRLAPAVTIDVKEFTRTSAIVEGNIIWPDYPDGILREYGILCDWGIFFGTEPIPAVHGNYYGIWEYFGDYGELPSINDDMFIYPLKNLTPGTLYYVTAVILLDDFDTVYGNEVTFTTSQ